MEHLTQKLLERFVSLSTDADENKAIVIHLLSGCPRCTAAAKQLVFPPARSEPPDPADLMEPGELVDQARDHLSSAFSALDQLQKSLAGEELPHSPEGRFNIVPFTERPTRRTRNDVRTRNPRNAS